MRLFARSRPSPAMVVAVVALSFALAGSAVAGTDAVISDVSKKQVKKIAKQQAKKQINKRAVTLGGVAGGDLTGTYPDPLIGDQKVTTAKIATDAVTATKIAANAVTEPKIATDAVTTDKIAANAVNGAKVAPDSLTGANINEATLGQVPDADRVDGKHASAFTSSSIYKRESAVQAGTDLPDGTQFIDQACFPGDILLTGGPANIAATTDLLEVFPTPGTTNSWRARVNKNGMTDNFSVVALCADQ